MNKNTRRYLRGVAFGFLGMILYTFVLEGYENIDFMYVLNTLKVFVIPFLFTEMWVAISVEGCRNLIDQAIVYKKKLEAKRNSKKKGAEA